MTENIHESGQRHREQFPVIDFFKRWGQYHWKDRLALAIAQGFTIGTLIKVARFGSDTLSSHVSEIAILALVPFGWSISAAIAMRREAIMRDHFSNLK